MEKNKIMHSCFFEDLGLIDYDAAWIRQEAAVAQVQAGGPQRVLICEHPPLLTLGRLAAPEHILFPQAELEEAGIRVLRVNRGGEVTLHAPGQLVVYPILYLPFYGKDLKKYLHNLEQVAIDLLKDFDIVADRFLGRTGVWFGAKKIVSIGVGVKKWVSFHGLALNVNTDLELFRWIRPCGLNVQMTSMAAIKGQLVPMSDVKQRLSRRMAACFSLRCQDELI